MTDPVGLILQEVADIYAWLDDRIDRTLGRSCLACGQCCDFGTFGHHLYVCTPELVYFHHHTGARRPMPNGWCPYNQAQRCLVHEHRFSGCRVFQCRNDADLQGRLSEQVLARFKALCDRTGLAYRYMDLAQALNEGFVCICPQAEVPDPEDD